MRHWLFFEPWPRGNWGIYWSTGCTMSPGPLSISINWYFLPSYENSRSSCIKTRCMSPSLCLKSVEGPHENENCPPRNRTEPLTTNRRTSNRKTAFYQKLSLLFESRVVAKLRMLPITVVATSYLSFIFPSSQPSMARSQNIRANYWTALAWRGES